MKYGFVCCCAIMVLNITSYILYHYRVNLPLPYFLSECLYAPTSELENIKTIPLYVFTLDHSIVLVDSSSQHHKLHSAHNQDVSSCTQGSLSQPHTQPLEHESVLPCVWLSELIEIVNRYSCWILDVDLDFFSTLNPFKNLFTQVSHLSNYVYFSVSLILFISTYVEYIYVYSTLFACGADSYQLHMILNHHRAVMTEHFLSLSLSLSLTLCLSLFVFVSLSHTPCCIYHSRNSLFL